MKCIRLITGVLRAAIKLFLVINRNNRDLIGYILALHGA